MENFLRTLRPAGERPVALVTGASAGLGQLFAERLASKGCNLILTARRAERLNELRDSLKARHGTESLVIPLDLAQPGAARELFEAVRRAGWQTDILVNNAGFGFYGPFLSKSSEEIVRLCQLNVAAVAELTRYVLPAMVERGRGGVLNVSSLTALSPLPMLGLYAATKAFLLSFSQSLSAEYSAAGVRIVCSCPGATATEFDQVAMGKDDARGRPRELPPEVVVDSALAALGRNQWVDFPGISFKVEAVLLRLVPKRLLMKFSLRSIEKRLHLTRAG